MPVVVVREGKEVRLTARIARLEEEEAAKVADVEVDGKNKLGLSVQPLTPPMASELGLQVREGVLVRDVAAGSRAGEAGIRAGDVIVEVNRQPVRTVEELKTHIDNQVKGAPMVLLIRREGGAMYVAIPAV